MRVIGISLALLTLLNGFSRYENIYKSSCLFSAWFHFNLKRGRECLELIWQTRNFATSHLPDFEVSRKDEPNVPKIRSYHIKFVRWDWSYTCKKWIFLDNFLEGLNFLSFFQLCPSKQNFEKLKELKFFIDEYLWWSQN